MINNTGSNFIYTGQLSYYTVPPNVFAVDIWAAGGAGGDNAMLSGSGKGGKGAFIQGTFSVTPGQVWS